MRPGAGNTPGRRIMPESVRRLDDDPVYPVGVGVDFNRLAVRTAGPQQLEGTVDPDVEGRQHAAERRGGQLGRTGTPGTGQLQIGQRRPDGALHRRVPAQGLLDGGGREGGVRDHWLEGLAP